MQIVSKKYKNLCKKIRVFNKLNIWSEKTLFRYFLNKK